MKKEILFLSLEDVVSAGGLDVKTAAEHLEHGFRLLSLGRVQQPMKTTLKPICEGGESEMGLVNCLPAYINLGEEEVFSCKILGAMPPNVRRGLPRATGLLTLFDSVHKSPLCVMDAQLISAVRTGAVSLLAARRLVSPETEEVGLVGAGVNMRTQLLALHHALPSLKRARVVSRGESKYEFAREMERMTGIQIKAVQTPEDAVSGCKLVVTCLPNVTQPVVKAQWIDKVGVTVFNIGCYEVEATLLSRMDRIVADVWEQGKHRGVQTHAQAVAQGIIPETRVEDLAPILVGERPGRSARDENIFFCPTGLGFEDGIVGWNIYKSALARRIGTTLTLWNSPKWI
ncbi:ornithine cyclodeaminase family protein [Aquincola sp. S2]|uniref:Ornithine cyclodeaminase family protein n=2 Tax=Pseudaquabacterium terrae TaxID=2732868 RepID=A0ABX2EA35_9BURK|nr:ornithine cyclodeaminase family protein [Aquabacterium terrae]